MSTDRTGKLTENIVHFARALRRAGLRVGPAAVVDAVRAVEVAGIATREDFYWTLHSIFVSRREQRAVFDEAFRLFWRRQGPIDQLFSEAPEESAEEDGPRAGQRRASDALYADAMPPRLPQERDEDVETRLVVSDLEKFRRKDFAQMSAAEIEEAKAEIERMVLPEDRVLARRRRISPPPGMIDMRRTLRASLRTGGDMILLRHRSRTEMLPPIVILADISGSMNQYTRIFLHFMHALTEKRRKVHSFLFGTRLTNVSRQLRLKDPDEALAACSDTVTDWSGGTRIATALHSFNRLWGRRVLGQGAIVLLFTDGLERDVGDDLAREMDRLHRSCRRLIWLNPLLGFGAFEARARGIRTMLPYVDEFRPIHSLEAMSDLCEALSGKGDALRDPRGWLAAA